MQRHPSDKNGFQAIIDFKMWFIHLCNLSSWSISSLNWPMTDNFCKNRHPSFCVQSSLQFEGYLNSGWFLIFGFLRVSYFIGFFCYVMLCYVTLRLFSVAIIEPNQKCKSRFYSHTAKRRHSSLNIWTGRIAITELIRPVQFIQSPKRNSFPLYIKARTGLNEDVKLKAVSLPPFWYKQVTMIIGMRVPHPLWP